MLLILMHLVQTTHSFPQNLVLYLHHIQIGTVRPLLPAEKSLFHPLSRHNIYPLQHQFRHLMQHRNHHREMSSRVQQN